MNENELVVMERTLLAGVTLLLRPCQILHPFLLVLLLLSVLFQIYLLLDHTDSLGILLLTDQVLEVYQVLLKEGVVETISLLNLVSHF
jgi:hypothetical protein